MDKYKYKCNNCGEFCDVVTEEWSEQWSEQYEHFGNICYRYFEVEVSDCCRADVEEIDEDK